MDLEHAQVRTNGINLHVVKAGPEDGPLAILLHGFPEYWGGWRKQIGPLAEAGYRVIVPDQSGYGTSDKPTKISDYDIDELAHDICGLSSSVGLASGWQPSYRCCPRRQRGESSYPFEDRSVQPTRDRHLRHLEGYVLGMPNHFGPDLDQLLPQCGQRPVLYTLGQRQSTQEVGQVIGEGK